MFLHQGPGLEKCPKDIPLGFTRHPHDPVHLEGHPFSTAKGGQAVNSVWFQALVHYIPQDALLCALPGGGQLGALSQDHVTQVCLANVVCPDPIDRVPCKLAVSEELHKGIESAAVD